MKLLCFDCDSTLSGIEGVDELARMHGASVFAEVAALTNLAMGGEIPLDQVFGRRLALIRPSREDCVRVSEMYAETAAPGIEEVLAAAREAGWTPLIISGGFLPCIRPFADRLGISEVWAVDLRFHDDGTYAGYDEQAPTGLAGGKRDVLNALLKRYQASTSMMVGDGASDMETKGLAARCIGFGGFVARPAVVAEADLFIRDLRELLPLLK